MLLASFIYNECSPSGGTTRTKHSLIFHNFCALFFLLSVFINTYNDRKDETTAPSSLKFISLLLEISLHLKR